MSLLIKKVGDYMPSGFAINEDGMVFMVNTAYYIKVEDDPTIFRWSCGFHEIKNKRLADTFELMKADVTWHNDGSWRVDIDFDENAKDEYRVYKVLEVIEGE